MNLFFQVYDVKYFWQELIDFLLTVYVILAQLRIILWLNLIEKFLVGQWGEEAAATAAAAAHRHPNQPSTAEWWGRVSHQYLISDNEVWLPFNTVYLAAVRDIH